MSQAYQQRIIRSTRSWFEHVLKSTQKKLDQLQFECKHPDKSYKHDVREVGYDGYSTSTEVTTTFTCHDCGCIWSIDGY
jgi:hypothetical protein